MSRRRLRACLPLAAAIATVAAATGPAVVVRPVAAYAIDHSKGQPGFCRSATGVTVVVDFQQLGGTTIVRCNPQASRGTGLDALKGAGFQIAGVQRWGEAFICRIENRPSAVEDIPVVGRGTYREACKDTPPAAAYWSYWHAGNNCPWEYSQWGVKNRDFIPGGFEGWSFSLNATAETNPSPRIAAVRPGTSYQPCRAPKEPTPTSNDPNERQPRAGGTGTGSSGTGNNGAANQDPTNQDPTGSAARESDGVSLPPPRPRSGAPVAGPAETSEYTGGEQAEDVNELIRRQSGASRYAPWVAGAVVLLLAAATWLTARRRARNRTT